MDEWLFIAGQTKRQTNASDSLRGRVFFRCGHAYFNAWRALHADRKLGRRVTSNLVAPHPPLVLSGHAASLAPY